MYNVYLGILIVVCLAVGWAGRGLVDGKKSEFKPAMAYGIDETTQLWNRVRVDSNGFVKCSRE